MSAVARPITSPRRSPLWATSENRPRSWALKRCWAVVRIRRSSMVVMPVSGTVGSPQRPAGCGRSAARPAGRRDGSPESRCDRRRPSGGFHQGIRRSVVLPLHWLPWHLTLFPAWISLVLSITSGPAGRQRAPRHELLDGNAGHGNLGRTSKVPLAERGCGRPPRGHRRQAKSGGRKLLRPNKLRKTSRS